MLGTSPEDQEGALPGGELICDDVQASITNNTFDDIMDAVKQERNYAGISSKNVMRCIPRGLRLHPGKPGWLTCRHCRKNGPICSSSATILACLHTRRCAQSYLYSPGPSYASGTLPLPLAQTLDWPRPGLVWACHPSPRPHTFLLRSCACTN